jgi:hypothetical protein
MPPSQTIQMSLYSPAARRPHFACSQCVRCFFNRAGLKSHTHAKHPSTYSPGPLQPPPVHEPTSRQQSSDEERRSPSAEIHETTSPPSTDRLQPPLFDNYDNCDDYSYHTEDNVLAGSASRSSTPVSVPSSRSHERNTCARARGSLPPIGIFEKCIIQCSTVRYSLTF